MNAWLPRRRDGDAIFGANDSADLMSSYSCFLLLSLNWDRGGSRDCLSLMSWLCNYGSYCRTPGLNPSRFCFIIYFYVILP